ncbi:UNVERIFIED_CONTAM: hypothetical protein PYX00_003349 [Menopon gallinae]|uniref:Uncharacterized protein n=1 Tax=Menopon gallinae TaxID=328185 RepID=A0AAW2HZJ0_9NEOP
MPSLSRRKRIAPDIKNGPQLVPDRYRIKPERAHRIYDFICRYLGNNTVPDGQHPQSEIGRLTAGKGKTQNTRKCPRRTVISSLQWYENRNELSNVHPGRGLTNSRMSRTWMTTTTASRL